MSKNMYNTQCLYIKVAIIIRLPTLVKICVNNVHKSSVYVH